MEKKILKVLSMVILLSACGVFKESSHNKQIFPSVPSVPYETNVESTSNLKPSKIIRYINAFSISDLYKSREKILSRRKSPKREPEPIIQTEVKKLDIISMVEIIQVVDEDGNIVANKRIK